MKRNKTLLIFCLIGLIISFFLPWFNVQINDKVYSFTSLKLIHSFDKLLDLSDSVDINDFNFLASYITLLYLLPILNIGLLILLALKKKMNLLGVISNLFSIIFVFIIFITMKEFLQYMSFEIGIYLFGVFTLASLLLSMVSEKTTEQSQNTKDIVVSGLLIALVFISTYFIQFHLPLSLNSGGLVHLGNTMLFSIAIVFGKKKGAVAGAFGMGLFDIIAGWALWAPCTFIVRGVQGYLIGLIANGNDRKGNSVVWNIVAISISSAWMIAGYFIYNIALYQNWAAALSSIPGDVLQTVIGIILGLPLVSALKRIKGVAL